MIDTTIEQHSPEWYVSRLGKITGSEVWKIFEGSRKKDEKFGEKAKSYLIKKAAERDMDERVLDDHERFLDYMEFIDISSKAMRWGTEQEPNARDLYKAIRRVKVEETGLCVHDEMKFFGSSPDGIVRGDDGNIVGTIEIKCPSQDTYFTYKKYISDGSSLKSVKKEYYWQCQSHMLVTGADWCDFIAYCPWQKGFIHVARIERNEKDISSLIERLKEAEEYILELLA